MLFDSNGCIKKYSTALDILEEFYYLRLDRYVMRKEYLEGKLQAEADRISAQARFVSEMYSGIIVFSKPTMYMYTYVRIYIYIADEDLRVETFYSKDLMLLLFNKLYIRITYIYVHIRIRIF